MVVCWVSSWRLMFAVACGMRFGDNLAGAFVLQVWQGSGGRNRLVLAPLCSPLLSKDLLFTGFGIWLDNC